ncbi:SDR family oxidoreductase [Frankia sp. AiPs1]|uniref:SDR family NAD(P)-dependent oxidoreductase n=1 Tax=Frankia sp. AiPs1 TaxID=573493 RepID=UPI0020439522|nr:SDR family NAD(P)-dependent oxidoreductase [Frankia sp. AiPs1]MCM3920950.1 SDR family oxidoreductase [Frankia sp. AiPs1]
MSLRGRVALVTGAASGIGAATARVLAADGARVVVADIDQQGEAVAKEIVAAGGEAVFQRVDVRRRDEVRAAVAAAESTFGHLDTVIANAGTVGGPAVARRLEDLDEERWTAILDINLAGTIRTFAAAVPALRRAGGGAMSATASIAGLTGVAGQAAYSASKGGIIAVVRALAFELVADRIRVNCACPGGVATNLLANTDVLPVLMAQAEAQARADAAPATAPATASASAGPVGGPGAQALMNRAADPVEVARVHRFLVSDEASLVNGQAVVCDAGSSVANLWMVIDR